MKEDLEKLEKEYRELTEKFQELERQKSEILTRMVEIQGVIKYLKEKEKENKN